jgi:hypothetical protein
MIEVSEVRQRHQTSVPVDTFGEGESIGATPFLGAEGTVFHTWQEAIPDACKAVLRLNGYANRRGCQPSKKLKSFQLKVEFIELLYSLGYCVYCCPYEQIVSPATCARCDGTGHLAENGVYCRSCRGTGTWGLKPISFVRFSFAVGDELYTWSVPHSKIRFRFKKLTSSFLPTGLSEDYAPNSDATWEADCKLLKWVVRGWRSEMN